jgi:O-antigen/teichoic acid export membrane protein
MTGETIVESRQPRAEDMASHMLRGSLWMVGMRWAIRCVGLASTLILARVLAPQDFGIIAIATIVTGFFEIFAETGQRLAIIRHAAPTREHLDTAWTMQVIICTVLAVGVFLSAPFAQAYFHEPHAPDVVRVLSLRVLFIGLENIGTVAFRRDLDFRKEFLYGLYQKLGGAVLTIILALTLRSFWALAIGIVVGQAASAIISYLMHPYRPRISFQHVRELWGFSIWMLVGHVSAYAQSRVDQIALGGVADSTRLGQYTVAMDVATLPTIELALPAARALYPTYSRLSGDLTELKKAFLMTLGAVAAICWSAGPGVALVSHDFVAVLLGSQWLSVIPIVPWLALSGALFALSNTVLTVHQATGRARTFALQAWMRVVIMAPLVIYAAQSGDLERLAQAQFLASAVFTPIIFASLRSIIGLTMMDVIRANIRPAISAGMMWIVVPPAIEALSFLPPVARLFVSVAIGGAVFVATMLVLWYIAGRPMGVESSTLATLSKVWRRVRATP